MQLAVRYWCVCAFFAFAHAALAAEDEPTPTVPETIVEAEPAEVLAVGSWLNSPPNREAVAFDAKFNRVYFNGQGKVVGRYNRATKQFEAGEFRPATWHNIALIDDPELRKTSADTKTASSAGDGKTSDGATAPVGSAAPPDGKDFKPAEVYRRGQAAGRQARGTRAKVIESFKP